FSGDRTTKDVVYKLEVLAFVFLHPFFISRSEVKLDVGKLTTTTGLLFQHFTVFYSSSKCFFVSHLRSTLVYFYLKLTTHTVNDYFQVQLTHTTKDGLTGIFISDYAQ